MSSTNGVCIVCLNNKRSPENEVLICDNCKLGYHQKCHKPLVSGDILSPEMPWICRRCLYSLLVKEGEEEMISRMKTLPYNLESLQWDDEHRVNQENTYCYCGTPGEFHAKMLQCRRCWQWFHGECIAALKYPLLFGDHYYLFTCRICNEGCEILIRIEMDISSMLAIVLNHLSLTCEEAFFSIQNHIVPFIKNHSHYFELDFDLTKLKDEQLINRITCELQEDDRFMSSVKLAFRTNLWAIKRSALKTPYGFLFYPNKFQFKTIKELSKKSNHKILVFESRLKDTRAATSEMASEAENVCCPRNESEHCPRDLIATVKRRRGRPRKAARNGRKKQLYAPRIGSRKKLTDGVRLCSNSAVKRSRKGRRRKMEPKINGGKTSFSASLVTNNKEENLASQNLNTDCSQREHNISSCTTSSAKRTSSEATVGCKCEPVNGSRHEPCDDEIVSQASAVINCDKTGEEMKDLLQITHESRKKSAERNISDQENPNPSGKLRSRLNNCVQF